MKTLAVCISELFESNPLRDKIAVASISCMKRGLLLASFILFPLAAFAAQSPVSDALRPLVDKGSIAGAVTIVATSDRILDFSTVGCSDIESKTPMKKNSVFWMASQSKTINAAAFMILVDEGKVSLDDPVYKYIPAFKNMNVKAGKAGEARDAKNPILVRHLLAHTSGLPRVATGEGRQLDVLTQEEAVKLYTKEPLLFEPGTGYTYTNVGMNTAGRLIEIISGKSYEDFINERVFKPLDMTDTTFVPNKEQLSRLVSAYGIGNAKDGSAKNDIVVLSNPLDNPKRQPVPGGGLFSTAGDMLNFARMLQGKGEYNGKRIISKKSWEEMTKVQTPDNIKSLYGLGMRFLDNMTAYGHGGAFGTFFYNYKDKDLILIYMVQRTPIAQRADDAQLEELGSKDLNEGFYIFKTSALKFYKDSMK